MVDWLICSRVGMVGCRMARLMSSRICRSFTMLTLQSGLCVTFVTFSKRTVWRQLRCLPRSVFSGGAVESSCGIQPVHASSSASPF